MDNQKLKSIIEAALLASGGSLSLDQMLQLFEQDSMPEKKALREVLAELADDYEGRGMQITETGSGWRIQIRAEYADWVSRLWEEKPARYSRALMETLALIAYRQPITRGEIEDVRGVSVSTNIIKTLQEREWIRVVGHRDVPGKPALYATSRIFLDYFNLKSLNDLPSLAEIRDLDSINKELELNDPDKLEEKDEQAENGAQDIEPLEVASTDDQETTAEVIAAQPAADQPPIASLDQSPEQPESDDSETDSSQSQIEH
ncbi:MAG: SMC-Scp complex subunit ScpB [Gammaproteobacteria bacterium]|nr:SMC-Scp complex subunit ScpB [Gammaproteobacteria bacterium]